MIESLTWGSLTLGGTSGYRLSSVTGWLDLPGAAYDSQPSSGHGESASPGVQSARTVLATGYLEPWGDANALVAALRAGTIPRGATDPTLDDLVGTFAGVTLTVRAQVSRRTVSLDPTRRLAGMLPWAVQWRCPDPFFYGDTITGSAALVAPSTGTIRPQTRPFTRADEPLGGSVSVVNPGMADSPVTITLTGGQGGTVGVDVNGVVSAWDVTLAANRGDGLPNTLVIDTARGGAYLDGAEYRPVKPGMANVARLMLPPGLSTVRALGSTGAGSPSISVAVRPRYW